MFFLELLLCCLKNNFARVVALITHSLALIVNRRIAIECTPALWKMQQLDEKINREITMNKKLKEYIF
ncbi:hypothetical protein THF1C08_190119 [Vibrio jasicida]|uniref:Uncharacterized protein n=1 Tax=Vibrio jasicida TaxID=766224 RepID=A0AAU9QKP9_9VIBR|nr:hypothetical protein THF1C08_190119 [Vibrio jasicida]CAH1588940.1 hypothetical protein THF1A12_200118 [Vibrio jasicida]